MATKHITNRPGPTYAPGLKPDLVQNRVPRIGSTVGKLSVLWESRPFLYRCSLFALVLSVFVVFLIPVRYTSTTRLMPPDSAGGGMSSILAALTKGGSSELASLGGELFGLKSNGEVFVGMLHSNTVENALVDKFDLRKVYGARTYTSARDDLEDRTDISADRKSGIISIKVSDRSAPRAAEMGREYVNQLNRLVTGLDTSAAHRERVFLEGRLNEVQVQLEAAEKEFSAFASKNTALDVKEQGRAMIGAAADLEGQLIAAQTSLEGLRQIYTANNVRVRSLQARIDEYRRQLQKMGGKTPSESGNASAQSGAASNSEQTDYPTIRELPILGVTWSDLYRRTRVEEVVFETLTKQYEMAKVEEAREIPSVKVLDGADVPEKKSFPPRLLFIVLGTLFGFICACIWSLASSRWRDLDPGDPGKLLFLDVSRTIRSAPLVERTMARFKGKMKTRDRRDNRAGVAEEKGKAPEDQYPDWQSSAD
jgi:uncharacterized protein involved in exopolysaccharide biosynthesis